MRRRLAREGYTIREILDKNELCTEALKSFNLPVSYLIPKTEPKEMSLQEWNTHTSIFKKCCSRVETRFCDVENKITILLTKVNNTNNIFSINKTNLYQQFILSGIGSFFY